MTKKFQKLAELFSADAFRGLSQPDVGLFVRRIIDSAKITGLSRRMRLRTVLDKSFEHLLENYRCEYVYKNALTNNVLLRNHDLGQNETSARLLTEFWVDDVRADLAVINGTSTVYEIKTSFDTIVRLPRQIRGYSKLFDKVYVVTSASMKRSIETIVPDHVGILVMDNDGEFEVDKAATSNKANVDVQIIFRSLRQLEVLEFCRELSGLPFEQPNGLRTAACWEFFKELGPVDAHDAMVSMIKRRSIHPVQKQLIEAAPTSLKHLCIGKSLGVGQYRAILAQLDVLV